MKIVGYVSPEGQRFMAPLVYAAMLKERPERVEGWQPMVLAEPLQPVIGDLQHIAEYAQLPYSERLGYCWSVGGEVQDWAADLLKKVGFK